VGRLDAVDQLFVTIHKRPLVRRSIAEEFMVGQAE
jgi:hypothetical protein